MPPAAADPPAPKKTLLMGPKRHGKNFDPNRSTFSHQDSKLSNRLGSKLQNKERSKSRGAPLSPRTNNQMS